jgi:hypothetical protein
LILIKQISGGHIGVAVVKGAGRLFDLASDLLNTGVNLGMLAGSGSVRRRPRRCRPIEMT